LFQIFVISNIQDLIETDPGIIKANAQLLTPFLNRLLLLRLHSARGQDNSKELMQNSAPAASIPSPEVATKKPLVKANEAASIPSPEVATKKLLVKANEL